MPMEVGVVNGPAKGYTEEMLDLINGFWFGVLMMTVGLSTIKDPKEFLYRTQVTAALFEADLPSWFDLAFVERMQKDDWYTNCSVKSRRTWKADVKNLMFDRLERSIKE